MSTTDSLKIMHVLALVVRFSQVILEGMLLRAQSPGLVRFEPPHHFEMGQVGSDCVIPGYFHLLRQNMYFWQRE